MKCTKCDHPKNLRSKRVDFDYSETSGIEGAVLHGVKQFNCPKCKTQFHELGDMKAIATEFAGMLISKEKLNRREVKYLRTHFFEETYFQFGKRLGVNPQVLREIELGKRPVSETNSKKIQDAVVKSTGEDISIVFDL